MLHDILTVEGIGRPTGGGAVVDNAFGEGIAPYYGGDLMTTTNQTDVAYAGNPVFIERDDRDYRYYTETAKGIFGDAATETITTWTLDTAGTPTGSFNADVTGTYIGMGSIIRIQDDSNKQRYITATITANLSTAGAVADEVYLSAAIPSGVVSFIGGKYTYIAVPIGQVSSAGVLITNTTLNEDGMMLGFRALCP